MDKLFPSWESLVSDIPAGDGNLANQFFTVQLEVQVAEATDFILHCTNKEAISFLD
jgi:hypothetical protein